MGSLNIVNLVESLPSSPWIFLSSLIITALSFCGMILFYYKAKKEKIPYYHIKSTNVIQDLNEKFGPLEVTYAGNTIKNMTVTRIGFWNAGKETIEKKDIAPAAPLAIKVKEGCQILDLKIFSPNETPNNFKYNLADNLSSINFSFDYIDKNEGVIFQILHTGISNKDVELTGKIIGAKNPEFCYNIFPPSQLPTFILNRIDNHKYLKILNNLYNLGITSMIIIFEIILVAAYSNIEMLPIELRFVTKFLLSILILFTGIIIALILILLYSSLTEQMPEGFDLNCDNNVFE